MRFRKLLPLILLALSVPAFAASPFSATVVAGQGATGSPLVVSFTWTNPTQAACPGTNPTSCASNYTLVDTTGLSSGAALPTAACTATVTTACVAAASISITSSAYTYTPLEAISSTASYSHTYVLVTNGFNSVGQAITANSSSATVTYTPFTLPAVTGFAGSIT